jgi:Ca-activated chloride channel family protein
MRSTISILLLLVCSLLVSAQNERKIIRQGVKEYNQGDFSEAEVQFRKAGDLNNKSFEADFNTGDALYGQEKYQETVKQFESLSQQSSDPKQLSKIWHNMGNSLLEAQQYQASIEAYKNSLRLNPSDMDTKYNLAYARKKLQDQQQQNQDQQNKDSKQNQDQQQSQEQQAQSQEQQAQNQDQQQSQDQQAQNQEQDQQDQQAQQAKPLEISREDAQRMLSAIQQQEKDVKAKVDKQKAMAVKAKTEKDW